MIVAFMGNDGSGKTTVIKLLERKLAESRRQVIYVPGFSHFLLDKFKKIFGGLVGVDMASFQKEYNKSKKQKTNLLFYLWPYLVLVDCLCLFFKYRFRFNRIIIFDRYFYDYVISFREIGVASWLEELLFLRLPRPKIGYVFDVSATVAYGRKKLTHTVDLAYYENQRARYLWLAKSKGISLINTEEKTPEDIAQMIFEEIKTYECGIN